MKPLITLFALLISSTAFADCRYERAPSGEYVYVCTTDGHRPDPDDGVVQCWTAYDPQTGQDVLVCE